MHWIVLDKAANVIAALSPIVLHIKEIGTLLGGRENMVKRKSNIPTGAWTRV